MMWNLDEIAGDERTARMALSMLVEPENAVTGHLLATVGAVEALRLAVSDAAVPGFGASDALTWRRGFLASRTESLRERLVSARRAGFGVVIPGDDEWPAALDELGERAPFALWTYGDASLLARPLADLVTITGARVATSYGEQVACSFASELAEGGRGVVAGGAFGIDAVAHRAAVGVDGGTTIAVLPGGLDRLYPAANRELLERVGEGGLLVSEAAPGATPIRTRFLARGRLLAALSAATVVVEAGPRSGAIKVAQRARQLGRVVGAIPGAITSAASSGTNQLIEDGTARLVTSPDQLAQWVTA